MYRVMENRVTHIFSLLPVVVLLVGCGSYNENAPIYFGSARTLGVSASSVSGGQAPEITVGFREVNFVTLPTIAKSETDGEVNLLTSTSEVATNKLPKGEEDTFSTYAAFNTNANSANTGGIATIFATGPAARISACRENGRHKTCSSK
ncbi:MAG: hypothetical protein NXI27_09610 [Alphaproteobacteria bacterium]|nr:hypothetical protein [Alphaproteobacteria bacterium]